MKTLQGKIFAAAGDVHGDFRLLRNALDAALGSKGIREEDLSALFLVGDVEAIRNEAEKEMVHTPAKYSKMGDFKEVLQGEISFEVPTYFIGGNHEPWEALDANGGLSASGGEWGGNFFFLGRSGEVEIEGLKVAFLSGISSPEMRRAGKAGEVRDRDRSNKRNRTHWTQPEVDKVMQSSWQTDLFLGHEWPLGLGVGRNGLSAGSWQVNEILAKLQPKLSLYGHMHFSSEGTIEGVPSLGLSHISNGPQAVKLFLKTDDGEINLL